MSIEKILIASSKGKISVAINHPEKQTEKLAILCSGFLDSKDYAHLAGLAGDLSREGYTVARFDAYGIWESEGVSEDYTTTQYLEDLKSVLNFMLTKGEYTHVLLGGHSKGGTMAMYHACQDPRISAVLAIMSTFPFIKESNKPIIEKWENLGKRISKRDKPGSDEIVEIEIPYFYVADRLQYDLWTELPKLHVPLIMIAGEKDELALPEDVRELFDQAPEPKEFRLIPNIGHDYRKYPEQIALVNETIITTLKKLI